MKPRTAFELAMWNRAAELAEAEGLPLIAERLRGLRDNPPTLYQSTDGLRSRYDYSKNINWLGRGRTGHW